jgi:hypothetical protein
LRNHIPQKYQRIQPFYMVETIIRAKQRRKSTVDG